jgi:hypothetical protein
MKMDDDMSRLRKTAIKTAQGFFTTRNITHDAAEAIVRAVLMELREPSPEMYVAALSADSVDGGTLRQNLRAMHQAAIDAALAHSADA